MRKELDFSFPQMKSNKIPAADTDRFCCRTVALGFVSVFGSQLTSLSSSHSHPPDGAVITPLAESHQRLVKSTWWVILTLNDFAARCLNALACKSQAK